MKRIAPIALMLVLLFATVRAFDVRAGTFEDGSIKVTACAQFAACAE